MYSFYKGNVQYSDFTLIGIENESYNVELKNIFENNIYTIFSEYGNVNIVNNSKDSMQIYIKKYSREPINYDDNGNIIVYKYFLISEFIINDSIKIPVNINKSFNSAIEERDCEDSIVIETIKKIIDNLRKEF